MIATGSFRDVGDTRDFRECFRAFEPVPRQKLRDWARENIITDQGRAYDDAAYPHHAAPGGPMDAFDDFSVRTISLQWATRLGKTFFGQCTTLYTVDVEPAPQMFASSSEKLAKEVSERTQEMIRRCRQLKAKLKRKKQRQDLIEFIRSKIYIAWARSASTLADKNIKRGHGGEIDKWEQRSTSKEADPLKLFTDRFKDYQSSRKVILESTPTVMGRSRIERLLLAGTYCRYHVPCRHCKRYQVLEMGNGQGHGLRWSRTAHGKHDSDLARTTAHYVCRHCGGRAENHDRRWMMRRGVWAPQGCGIRDEVALAIAEGRQAYVWRGWQKAEWITGTPLRDGVDASYQLSTLYALSVDWGDIAKEWIDSQGKPQHLRNFINQWLGECWELTEKKQTWKQLGERIIVATPPGIIPAGFALVTAGIDKQSDHYKYVFDAWGAGRASHTVAYGRCETMAELREVLLDATFSFADQGAKPLRPKMALIDCGFKPAEVYHFVRECRRKRCRILPCRGSSIRLDTFIQKKKLGPKTSAPGQRIVYVDTESTQDWIDGQLHTLKPGDPGATSLFSAPVDEHQDFLEQLLNDAPIAELDDKNKMHESWTRVDPDVPNDYRDAKRYALAAMLVATRGAEIRVPTARGRQPAAADDKPARSPGVLPKFRFVKPGEFPSRRHR